MMYNTSSNESSIDLVYVAIFIYDALAIVDMVRALIISSWLTRRCPILSPLHYPSDLPYENMLSWSVGVMRGPKSDGLGLARKPAVPHWDHAVYYPILSIRYLQGGHLMCLTGLVLENDMPNSNWAVLHVY
jgi:hypothetical protein